jgi:hypothetical protein
VVHPKERPPPGAASNFMAPPAMIKLTIPLTAKCAQCRSSTPRGDCCCRIDAHCPGQDRETSVDIRAQLREPAFDMTEPPSIATNRPSIAASRLSIDAMWLS